MISSSAEHICIELDTPELLAEKLNAFVSANWPSGEYDRDAMAFFLSCFETGGYATEMVNMLVAHASSFDNISKIIAHTSAENIASVNVLTSCGFNAVAAFEGKSEGKAEGNLRRVSKS